MNFNKLIRTVLFIIGVVVIFLLLALGNITTDRITVSAGDLINFEELNEQIIFIRTRMGSNEFGRLRGIFKLEISVVASQAFSGIYMPRAKNVEFYVNGSMEDIIYENEHYIYLFEPADSPQKLSLEMRIPLPTHELYYSSSEVYVGDYDQIMFASYRESNLRLFIVGLTFTIILFSSQFVCSKTQRKIPTGVGIFGIFNFWLCAAKSLSFS